MKFERERKKKKKENNESDRKLRVKMNIIDVCV